MSEVCLICGGTGLRIIQQDGRQFAQDCVCRVQRRAERMLGRAQIPRRYEHCSLESYETDFPSSNRSLSLAHLRARKFVDGYPLETVGTGLLLTGSIGVGKTHLAVGILQALVAERGATGLFPRRPGPSDSTVPRYVGAVRAVDALRVATQFT